MYSLPHVDNGEQHEAMASGGPVGLPVVRTYMVTTVGVRWEKVYARAWDLGELKFDSDMAPGEAKDPSEMWQLIAYVKLQWGGTQLMLLPGDRRTYISTDIGILSPFELICGGDTDGASVVYCQKGSPRGLSAKALDATDFTALEQTLEG